VTVSSGGSQTFTIIPNAYYLIADVKVDGASVGKVSSYTFSNVIGNDYTLMKKSCSYLNTLLCNRSCKSLLPSSTQ
jgi:hypothetical protein